MGGYVTYKDGTGDTVPDGFTWITNHLTVSPATSVTTTGGYTIHNRRTIFLRVAFADGSAAVAETGYGNLCYFLSITAGLHHLPLDWFGEVRQDWAEGMQARVETIKQAFGRREW